MEKFDCERGIRGNITVDIRYNILLENGFREALSKQSNRQKKQQEKAGTTSYFLIVSRLYNRTYSEQAGGLQGPHTNCIEETQCSRVSREVF